MIKIVPAAPRKSSARAAKAASPATPSLRLAALGDQQLATLLAAACDITLLLDHDGVVRDITFGNDALARELGTGWRDRPWVDAVSDESQSKVTALLSPDGSGPRWRQVNLRLPHGGTLSMDCHAVAMDAPDGSGRCTLVMGRDERITASLQQRLVEAQLSVERDYARFRQAELRYRQLFQMAAEAMLVVDAGSGKVTEANPAAAELLGLATDKLVGQVFPVGLAARSARAVQSLLAAARRNSRGETVQARLADGRREVQLSATLFNQDNSSLLLVRLASAQAGLAAELPTSDTGLLLLLARQAPDALVITDTQGLIQACNQAFVQMTQLPSAETARGQSLERWLGRSGVDLGVLLSNLRQGGSVRLFATTLRDEFGASTEVGSSAVTASPSSAVSDAPVLGFAIRDVGRRLSADPGPARGLPGSANQLAELVGRVPMKDIVSETSDLIEKLCIEAALELTRDNRASAAEILGLSRQSLYVKLRRYGLGDLGAANDK